MRKGLFLLLVFAFTAVLLPVYAETENTVEPVVGSWMLDLVWKNASGPDKTVLSPDTSASLYMEAVNVYTFNQDGSAVQVVHDGEDTVTQKGSWKKSEDVYTFDVDDWMPMEFTYDKNELHRYWKDENPDADYHDLEFVYTRVPVGEWKMTQVFSGKTDADKTLMDPENAASLYSEGTNVYQWNNDGTGTITIFEGGEAAAAEKFTWTRESGLYVMKTADSEMTFAYDPEEDVLHRYWVSLATDSMYDNLDFVYTREAL